MSQNVLYMICLGCVFRCSVSVFCFDVLFRCSQQSVQEAPSNGGEQINISPQYKTFRHSTRSSRTMVFTDPRLKHLPLLYPPFFDFSVGTHAHNGLDVHGVHDMGRSSVRAHFVFQDIRPKTQLYFGLTCGRAKSKNRKR